MHILSKLEQDKFNNFNLIRLIAAVSVVFAHSFPLSLGFVPELFPGFRTAYFGDMAVLSFFSLSGFLITKSYCKNENAYSFIEARILRLLPGYILSLIYCILLGLLVTSTNFYSYLLSAIEFFSKHILYLSVNIPSSLLGVYSDNPAPNASNGSLWSLPAEIRMYILVLFLGFFQIFKKKYFLNLFFLSACFLMYVIFLYDSHLLDRAISFILRVPFYALIKFPLAFIIGMYAYLYKKYVPISPVIFMGLIGAFFLLPYSLYLETVVASYTVLFLGFYPRLIIKKLISIPDYSYGIYIFSYPTQQALVSILKIYDPYILFALSLCFTLFIAIFSWHYIEKPSLRLKGKTKNYLLFLKSIKPA
ncbi:MAG: acyltransferase [Alphaproteobacteria bacterium]|nr:acyltransferase [Alphaproteobacteria bacterium]